MPKKYNLDLSTCDISDLIDDRDDTCGNGQGDKLLKFPKIKNN